MNLDEILKYWTLTTILKLFTQLRKGSTRIFDTYFKNRVPVYGRQTELTIERGSGIILKSINPDDDRLVQTNDKTYKIAITIPRFSLEKTIPPSEFNSIKALESQKDQRVALGKKIKAYLAKHKESYNSTLEFMAVGALFGKIFDGAGKLLFELKTAMAPIDFNGITIAAATAKIEDALVAEFGMVVPYKVYASRTFLDKVVAQATAANLFRDNRAKEIDYEGMQAYDIGGKKYLPYNPQYKDEDGNAKAFIPENGAIVIPEVDEAYEVVYCQAEHTEAVGKPATLFFAATPENLKKGKGIYLATEMNAIPYCVRPGGLIQLTHTA